MSENFAEDAEAQNGPIRKGFMEEGDEQNDLMMEDPGMEDMNLEMPKDTMADYNKMIADSQKRTESFSH